MSIIATSEKKFDLTVKYRWKYESDERNRIRRAEQAGRNESAVVAPVLNQTRNIPRSRRATIRPELAIQSCGDGGSRWVTASSFQANRVANSGRNSRGRAVRKVAGTSQKRENLFSLTVARGFRKRFAVGCILDNEKSFVL